MINIGPVCINVDGKSMVIENKPIIRCSHTGIENHYKKLS